VEGARVEATVQCGDAYIFFLASHPALVRIVSHSGAPAELGVARDPRVLGVAVRRIVLRQMTRFRVMDAANPLLVEGFHTFEQDNSVRWTDGDARLPAAIFDDFDGPMELVLHLGGNRAISAIR
jgi:hypothetical protein